MSFYLKMTIIVQQHFQVEIVFTSSLQLPNFSSPIFRKVWLLIIVMPILQLIVHSFAASNEVKNVNVAIVNLDQSPYSQQLIGKIQTSNRFTLVDAPLAITTADRLMQQGEVDVVVVIPSRFEKDSLKQRGADVQMLVNAINGQQATVGSAYLM